MEKEQTSSSDVISESGDQFRLILKRICDGLFSLDRDWLFTFINKKAADSFNTSPENLTGKNIWETFPQLPGGTLFTKCHKAMAAQQYECFEEYHEVADSWLETYIYPAEDGVTVYFKNITERKKREADCNKMADRNALLLHTMQNSFLLTDADLNVIDVNPAFCKTIGYSRAELLLMNVTDFDVLHSPSEIKQNLKRAMNTGIIHLETKNKKKDGSIIDVEVVLTEVEIDGQLYFASFGRNISERKRADEQILNAKKLSDFIINSLPGIFYLYDENWKFLRWNKNFETVSKYNSEEIANMSPLDFFTSEEKPLLKYKIAEVFEKGSADIEANFYTKTKQKIPYCFTGMRAEIEGKLCLLGMGIDITAHKAAEESMRLMEKEILNQKVQEQKRIIRAIIKAEETERNYLGRELHDNINQILAGAKLHLSLAGKKNDMVMDLVKYPLKLIDNSIDEIRLLTSKNVTPLRNVNLKTLIQKLLANIDKSTPIKTKLIYNESRKIINDDLKLNIYRIAQEQLTNIIKHAAASTITIDIDTRKKEINVQITDDGVGFNVCKAREGIGISNMINRVESFNGLIEINSSPGNGCSIKIEMPNDL